MNPTRVLAPLAVLIALVLSASAASAAAAPATLPTWTAGQAVAYGTHVDLTPEVQNYLNATKVNLTNAGATVNALTFTGTVDAWVYDQVSQVLTSQYVLSEQSAGGLKFTFNLNVSETMPVAGTYHGNCSYGFFIPTTPIPTAKQTLAVTASWTSLENGTSMSLYQKADLSLAQSKVNTTVRANAAINAYNVPSTQTNLTTCTETIAYKSENLGLQVNTQSQVRTTYTPTLDYFNFPINDGETWWANSTATLGADISGTIDVTGLSAQDQASFFENLTKTLGSLQGIGITGLSSFPIDLAKITVTVGGANVLQNGHIQDYPFPVAEDLRATSTVKTLADGNQHTVYRIAPASYACPTTFGASAETVAAVYAPDYPAANAGMIVGYDVLQCIGSTSLVVFSLDNVPTAQAQSNIQQTQTSYNPFPPSTSNALVDFFAASPFYGVWIVVAVVAVVAAILIVRRRRGPSMAAPPQPPQAPPPGPP